MKITNGQRAGELAREIDRWLDCSPFKQNGFLRPDSIKELENMILCKFNEMIPADPTAERDACEHCGWTCPKCNYIEPRKPK